MDNATPTRWVPDRSTKLPAWPVPKLIDALWRGARGLCPACGKGRLFAGFLKVRGACDSCHAPIGLARADDAPPYFTIVIVGHIIVPLMLAVEKNWAPDLWIHTALWVPLSLGMAIGLLTPVKGMTVGVMTAMGMLTEAGPG